MALDLAAKNQLTQEDYGPATPNSVPLVVVGEKSFFAPFLTKFVEGYSAKGMTHVEGGQILGAGHYVLTDNPKGVADLIEQHAGSGVNYA